MYITKKHSFVLCFQLSFPLCFLRNSSIYAEPENNYFIFPSLLCYFFRIYLLRFRVQVCLRRVLMNVACNMLQAALPAALNLLCLPGSQRKMLINMFIMRSVTKKEPRQTTATINELKRFLYQNKIPFFP